MAKTNIYLNFQGNAEEAFSAIVGVITNN